MQSKCAQMSLFDIYKKVAIDLEDNKLKMFRLLDEYIAWDTLTSERFHLAFY